MPEAQLAISLTFLLSDVSIHAPVRGATRQCAGYVLPDKVSIHAPRAGRDPSARCTPCDIRVSIHAPRAGRDRRSASRVTTVSRVSIHALFQTRQHESVSIHAPRAGRDNRPRGACRSCAGFNPRAPCGARLCLSPYLSHSSPFQSTRPVRGATYLDLVMLRRDDVSIPAPRAGRDSSLAAVVL